MGNPYHDPDNGQFTTKSGAGSGGGGSSGGKSGGTGSSGGSGTLNAADAKGKGAGKMFGVKATTDANGKTTYDFSERAAYVDEKLTDWRNRGIDTQKLYKKKNGEYTAARRKQQEALIAEIWAEQAEGVPNEGKALVAGGLGGAGKGFTLKNKLGIKERGAAEGANYFTVNPDVIKEKMAARGMIPKLDKNMTAMELSPLAHEEASDLAGELAKMAYVQKKNIVWDFTMSTTGSTKKRIDAMRSAGVDGKGYSEVNALFVDVTVDKSISQARSRWENGLIRYANDGKGDGGRFLPSAATNENRPEGKAKTGLSREYRSRNRETFEQMKSYFDGYQVYDNEVGSVLVDRKNDAGMGGGK